MALSSGRVKQPADLLYVTFEASAFSSQEKRSCFEVKQEVDKDVYEDVDEWNLSPSITEDHETTRNIWICGSSIVCGVANAVKQQEYNGINMWVDRLGAVIHWKCREDMQWTDLLPFLRSEAENCPPPDIIVIHLGESDLVNIGPVHLCSAIGQDLARIQQLFPDSILVWSDILERLYWHGVRGVRHLDEARRRVNRDIKKVVLSMGGRVVSHPQISHKVIQLYQSDGASLSDLGVATFLNFLQFGLEAFLTSATRVFP